MQARSKNHTSELDEFNQLTSYPTAERIATGTAKVLLGLLIGASTALAVVLAATVLHVAIVVGLMVGAFGYSVKAVNDVIKKNIEEKKLIAEVKKAEEEIAMLFVSEGELMRSIEMSMRQLNGLSLEERKSPFWQEWIEKLYSRLYELNEKVVQNIYADLPPGDRSISTLQDQFSTWIATVKSCRKDPEADPARFQRVGPIESSAEESSLLTNVLGAQEKPKRLSQIIGKGLSKFGNRALTFVGGASAAATVGIGIAILAFGVSNPVGWVLMGILVTSAIIGGVAIAVDYYASRKQENKIQKLHETKRHLGIRKHGAHMIDQDFRELNDQVKHHQNAKKDHLEKLDIVKEEERKKQEDMVKKITEVSLDQQKSLEALHEKALLDMANEQQAAKAQLIIEHEKKLRDLEDKYQQEKAALKKRVAELEKSPASLLSHQEGEGTKEIFQALHVHEFSMNKAAEIKESKQEEKPEQLEKSEPKQPLKRSEEKKHEEGEGGENNRP